MARYSLTLLGLGVLLLAPILAEAQTSRADQLYEQFRFKEAIPLYERVLKDDSTNLNALEKLALSHQKLRDFYAAETYFARLAEAPDRNPAALIQYGQILKRNGKGPLAKRQFQLYSEEVPNGFIGRLLAQSVKQVEEWKLRPDKYETFNLTDINTEKSEFSPVVYNDGLVFTTDQGGDIINDDNYNWSAFLSVYFSPFKSADKTEFGKSKLFSNKINGDYHDGPVTIDTNANVIYFTRVSAAKRGKQPQMQIFLATLDGKKVGKVEPFFLNSDDYSVGHPALSADGNRLYFTSDKPGGRGGMDLYMCRKLPDQSWGPMKNLGSRINTSGNEVFPTCGPNGELYFSSNVLPGYGGFDIFVAEFGSGRWIDPVNLRAPINSSSDDFGFAFLSDSVGYFSSDREGGKGSDDIYGFKRLPTIQTLDYAGVLDLPEKAGGGIRLELVDDDGTVIATVVTDSNGYFNFQELDPESTYLVRVAEEDMGLVDQAKLFMTNPEGKRVLLAEQLEQGLYTFHPVEPEKIAALEEVPEPEFVMNRFQVFGQVFSQLPGDYSAGMEVYAVDQEGNILEVAYTDSSGRFVFRSLTADEIHLFKLAEEDAELQVVLTDIAGDVTKVGEEQEEQGAYVFRKVRAEDNVMMLMQEAEDASYIAGVFEYKGLPAENVVLELLDENDQVIALVTTDENGEFAFDQLKGDAHYMVRVADHDSDYVHDSRLVITDQPGGTQTQLVEDLPSGTFVFTALNSEEDSELLAMQKINDESTVRGVFEYKGLPAENVVLEIVDENNVVIGTVITDESGNFAFEQLKADENYMVRLAENDDTDLSDVKLTITEQSGKKVREEIEMIGEVFTFRTVEEEEIGGLTIVRTEEPYIAGLFKSAGEAMGSVVLELVDENNNVVGTVMTEEDGSFVFTKLDAEENYMVRLAERDTDVELPEPVLLVTEESGKKVSKVADLTADAFVFTALPVEGVAALQGVDVKDITKTVDITGQIYKALPGDYTAGMEIYAVNEAGEILAVALTDSAGRFEFEELASDEHVLFQLGENDPDLKISILGNEGEVVNSTAMTDGEFIFYRLNQEENVFGLIANQDNTEFLLKNFKVVEPSDSSGVPVIEPVKPTGDDPVEPVPTVGGSPGFPVVFYEFGQMEISDKDKQELQEVVDYLKKYTSAKLVVASFSDSWGGADYNLILSKRRNVRVVNYLVAQGIQPNQLISRWYGEKYPRVNCGNGVWCHPTVRARNRRTEFTVVND